MSPVPDDLTANNRLTSLISQEIDLHDNSWYP